MKGRCQRRNAFANIEDQPVTSNELRGVPLDDKSVVRRKAKQSGACQDEGHYSDHVEPARQEATQ